ncbi:RidA family protein [Ruegeria marina]|uniref:Enamine deaminase RidA, house cleaning of reactive enamine intermediates, YjgF/YER057c/UK114 family n=1 Tax=Ruegeria marina TaxID=639004 RepID=A0A1G6V0R7_9RHOB|nr:RidA family protein [Ruegeria marina]SDD47200.1 Enamine deaminase RidA, house cleaning of reactive enamine intermediates, YjgF/YER057c/UK114 family [Ruegeria marina]
MKALNPTSIAPPFGNYSHGITDGHFVVTSGQLGLSKNGEVPNSVGAQAEICFANIHAILTECGLDYSNVIRFSAFVTRREDMAPYMEVRDRVLEGLTVKPASTLLIVSGFSRPEFLVEIEAIALRAQ